MTAEEIKQALLNKGFSYGMVAEAAELTPAYLSLVINRRNTSLRVAKIIANVLERPLAEVFPDVESYHNVGQLRGEARQQKVEELRQRLAS